MYIRFQLWHRSFDLLYIPFTLRFAAALLSIFRLFLSSQINMSNVAHWDAINAKTRVSANSVVCCKQGALAA